MKLISLNIWGGKILNPLLSFIEKHSEIDIFCFQEVFSSSIEKGLAKGMQSNIYEKIQAILTEYKGYFDPHLKNRDLSGKVDFNLSLGLAMFVKKSIPVKEQGKTFIYRSGYELADDNYETIPKNLQYLVVSKNNTDYLIANFHGIWYLRTKADTPDRIEQSKEIKNFLSVRNEKKILCGDFNLSPHTESIAILEKDLKNLIREFHISTTRNHFYPGKEKFADYIFVSPKVLVENFNALDTIVSDHLPLYLKFK